MRKIIALMVLAFLVADASALEDSLRVTVTYVRGSIRIAEVTLVKAESPPPMQDGDYAIKMLSPTGDVLYETKFSFSREYSMAAPKDIFDGQGRQIKPDTGGGTGGAKKKMMIITLPYHAMATKIVVVDSDGVQLASKGIKRYSDYCGDGRCSETENYGNCHLDCVSGMEDKYCDTVRDGVCDPDCRPENDVDCAEYLSDESMVYTMLITLAIVIIVLGIIYQLIFRK
ncbi:MAG: hypothetical protein ABIH11_03820 [Candidatus Altiarchaeota archaeon]